MDKKEYGGFCEIQEQRGSWKNGEEKRGREWNETHEEKVGEVGNKNR